MSLKALQAPPTWAHSTEEILALSKDAIANIQATEDKITALPPQECTFSSVFLTLADAKARFQSVTEPLAFYQNVSPDKELRDASSEAEELVRGFEVLSSMRIDVFNAKVAAEKNIKASGQTLNAEEKRLVDKTMLDGKRAGLALPEKQREELMKLKKELSQMCLEFNKNCNEETGVVTFTLEELEGVPADVISGYSKHSEDGKDLYDVTHQFPDISPVFKFAQNPDTRRRAYNSWDNRVSINVPLFTKIIELRRQIASLLGYDSWADYVTEDRMIKSARGVHDFLSELEQKLKPIGESDRVALLQLKKEEHDEKGLPFDSEFYAWDYNYYDRKYVAKTLDLDASLIKEYFPVTVVVPTVLRIYQDLLGVRFEEIKGETWHQDVQQFAVWDSNATDESGFLGYCYLDLYPRVGKYSGVAVWPLIPGYTQRETCERQAPAAAIVANLAKPTPEHPALLPHSDVVMFFHEMGHIFHELLSRTRFARFHGTSVAIDFGEAPSQMLENWCWEPTVLEKLSSHYETQKPLSKELINKLVKSRYVNVGLYNLQIMFMAQFDFKVHTSKVSEDYTLLWNNLRESIGLCKNGKILPGHAAFSHIIDSYDAGFYGYSYSLVFAADMFATVFKENPLDPALGKRYRDSILLHGASRDETDSLKEFLGREPNSQAFLDCIFGKA